MVVVLLVIAGAYWKFGRAPELVIPTTTGPAPTAAPVRSQAPPRSASGQIRRTVPAGTDPSIPQALKLAEMEQVPDEPQVGRNPFRFGVPPAPPPPPYVPPPPTPTPVYTPPPPPPIPPIPLKLTTIIPDVLNPTRPRAYLADPKTGTTFEGIEGQVIDGRYRLLKVGTQSVVMSYLDGTGQRTINVGG
jgi:hypothetical protein